MYRIFGIGLLSLSCAWGCNARTDYDTVPVTPETKQKVNEIGRKLQVALQKKDWNEVAALYWSGSQMSPEKAKETLEPDVDKTGSMESGSVNYIAYDTNDLSHEVGDDLIKKVGAPRELWRGFAEVVYYDFSSKQGIELTLEIGEENGKFVVLDIWDVYPYSDN